MAIISFLPDWIVFVIGIIILIIIYSFFPDNIKKSIRVFLGNYGVYVLLLVIWLYWHSRTGMIYEYPDKWPANINRATFFVGLMAGIYFAVKSWLYEFRYYTNHFICDNVQGSCHRYQEIGKVAGTNDPWVVFFLGGSGTSDEKFVFPWPWVKKIVVVPKSTCQFVGNQIIAYCQVEKVSSEFLPELDEDVADFITKDAFGRWVQEEVYIGYAPVDKLSSSPEYKDLKNELNKKNSRINELKEMLRGKLSITKQFVSDTLGMTDKIRGKEWRRQPPQQSREE